MAVYYSASIQLRRSGRITAPLTEREAALIAIGRWLDRDGYDFTTVTPETHRRVNARWNAQVASTPRDVFGWSRPFEADLLPPELMAELHTADVLTERAGLFRSKVRFSRLGGGLYAHSAYPTSVEQAVEFGPDTYRFCAAVARAITTPGSPARIGRLIDVGCGTGAGGLSLIDRVDHVTLADVSPEAVSFARVNTHLAGAAEQVELVHGDLFEPAMGLFDVIIANPPHLVDPLRRSARDGGGMLGTGLGLRIVREGLDKLVPGGRLILYTGSPIVEGKDTVRSTLADMLRDNPVIDRWSYEELEPDVMGDELEAAAYSNVERIAAVIATITVRAV